MSFTYGGVSLSVPPPEWHAWVEKTFTLQDLVPFRAGPHRSALSISWPTPWDYYGRTPLVRSNTLWWPVGASRWAMGFFYASESALADIRDEAYADDVYTPLDLVMDDGTNSITTEMYLLPPAPIAPQKVVAAADRSTWVLPRTIAADGTKSLYILPLVDERYFWWLKASAISVNEGTTTWAQLYSSIATALGITLTAEAVNSAYLTPPASLASNYEAIPLLLDAVATTVGQRVVRKLDGTVITIGPSASRTALVAQLTLNYPRVAGGLLAVDF